MTFQGTRGAKHGVQPWQTHHFLAKEFMRKIHDKEIYTSILARFQNDEVFHTSQLQHNWTKEWCEKLDYIRTIDISHNASNTIGTIRYVVSFSVRSETNGKRTHKSGPDYQQTTRAFVSMNKEAGQIQESKRRYNYREDLDPEKLDWLTRLSQLEMVLRGKPNFRFKFHTMVSPKISRSACLGKRRSIH